MNKNVKVLFFSGVHGAGKTTMIRDLQEHLEAIGEKVKVYPEFDKDKKSSGFNPGDPNFQIWYKYNILHRERGVLEKLSKLKNDKPIWILFDRSAVDVDVYNMYYNLLNGVNNQLEILADHTNINLGREMFPLQMGFPDMFKHFRVAFIHLDGHINVLKERLVKRVNTETHRENWNESNQKYLKGIRDMFRGFYDTMFSLGAPIIRGLSSTQNTNDIVEEINIFFERREKFIHSSNSSSKSANLSP